MPMHTTQRQLFEAGAKPQDRIDTITLGTVVDTNDPQEMGRIRVVCPKWGDSWNTKIEDLPWALYSSPIGGQAQIGTRGPGIQSSSGGVAYGLWAIPKVGAQVLVQCIDGNPMARVYTGCIYDQFTPHTLPHGRFMYDDHPALGQSTGSGPQGPYTSTESLIQPLADNLHRAFGGGPAIRYEYHTRGADYSVAAVDVSQLQYTYSKVADDKHAVSGKWTSTQGYQLNRTDPGTSARPNAESQVVSLTSPGFHAFSMDDRQENCRVRVRTTSGHQILMDDTNERVYIATAEGNNWIELDQAGNIDMYTSGNFSVHAERDINFDAGGAINVKAASGVNIKAGTNISLTAATDINVKAGATLRLTSNSHEEQAQSINMSASSTIAVDASQVGLLASGDLCITGSTIFQTASSNLTSVNIIRSATTPASPASVTAAQPASVPSRIPQHEPWARTMTKSDTSTDPEFAYDSDQVGRSERGRTISRGMFWRR